MAEDHNRGTPDARKGPRTGDYSAPGIGGEAPRGPGAPPAPPAGQQRGLVGEGQPPSTVGSREPGRQVAPGAAPQRSGHGTIPPSGVPPLPPRSGTGKKGGGGKTFLIALVAAIIGALVVLVAMPWAFGVNPWDLVRGRLRDSVRQDVVTTGGEVKIVSPTEGAAHVAHIAKEAIPSIVNIDIRTAPQQGLFFDFGPGEGTGSGVIYKEDGYIITNNHVVEGAEEITVTLASGEELTGEVVGTDPEYDIAVVKIEKNGLPTLELGDSDNLIVGELVVVLGSPFGFEQSVSAGIISALHRNVSAIVSNQGTILLTDLIQTDAAINPGNSGGAMCDSASRLIGINTIIATAAGGSEGVGFSIPINTASRIAEDIIAGRPVSHPYIGVSGQSLTGEIAEEYDLPVDTGAYVTNVIPEGPADKAGLKRGDIITEVDGEGIETMDDLIAEIRKRSVGDVVSITYFTDGEKKDVDITLEEKPSNL